MVLTGQGRLFECALSVLVIGVVGCRDHEPPPAHDYDLGSVDMVLMPTGSAWHDPGIADGKADWHPFREPQLAAAPAEAGGPSGSAEIEAEIRDLIDEYNDAVAEATTAGDLLDYYVEDQYDTLEPLLEAMLRLTAQLNEVRAALEAKLPDAKDRISSAFMVLAASHSAMLTLESVTVVSDTEVTGTAASHPEPTRCRFSVIDDAWYIELQDLPPYAQAKPALDAMLAIYEGWLQTLQSDQASGEQVLSGLEQAANAAAVATGQGAEEAANGDTAADDMEPASTGSDTP